MSEESAKANRVKIVYYTGTGGAQMVARRFEEAFGKIGYDVSAHRLTSKAVEDDEGYDLLTVIYAVHACNAPEAVYRWIESLKPVKDKPAVVISVSGGGDVTPNTACRRSCIRKLERKGYKTVYEQMLVMPSNWIVSTKEPLALLLLKVLPEKVRVIVNDIEKGSGRRTRPLLIDCLYSRIGEAEKKCTKFFGKRIRVSEKCNGCGMCSRSCPAGNITISLGKPQFGGGCHLCLGCIYGCPQKALSPGFGKFVVIKDGYDLNELQKKLPFSEEVDVEKLARGFLWSGIKKYLLDSDQS